MNQFVLFKVQGQSLEPTLEDVIMKAIIWDFLNTIYDSREGALYDGAKELLEKLHKKYKQALVSSTFDVHGRIELIKSFSIWGCFDRVEIGLKTKKLFLDICKEFGCDPCEVYIIGDNELNEIRIGNKLKMKTIWVDKRLRGSLEERLLGVNYWKKISKLSELSNFL